MAARKKKGAATEEAAEVRLHVVLARAGVGSRRACEKLISKGRVTVDGLPVTRLGTKVVPGRHSIAVDGKRVVIEEKVAYLLNKPRGIVTTAKDDLGRQAIVELIPERRRIFPVGRLDRDSDGLIVLTNDGEFANMLTHPKYGVKKTYRVRVSGELKGEAVERIRSGVRLREGRTAPAGVRIVKRSRQGATMEITISEGMNREVRRMLAAVGVKVRRLTRIRIGPFGLGRIPTGGWKKLSRRAVQRFKDSISTGRR